MNILINISKLLFPFFIFFTVTMCLISKNSLLISFKKGAKDGISTIVDIMPNIIIIMVATALFTKTGALTSLVEYISPFLMKLKIPKGLCELILMRPVSGGGSIVLLNNIYSFLGADSYEGLIASVIAASTETTFYTVSVYFGVTKVKKTFIPVMVGLCADFFTVMMSIFIINTLFF